jgi:hypothetical protein
VTSWSELPAQRYPAPSQKRHFALFPHPATLSQRFEFVAHFPSDGIVYGIRENEAGEQFIEIYRARLVPSRKSRRQTSKNDSPDSVSR